MVRSKWKGIYMGVWDYIAQNSIIWDRGLVIKASYVGEIVYVYNGFELKQFKIKASMVGYKFGEFSFTRKMWRAIINEKKKKFKIKKKK